MLESFIFDSRIYGRSHYGSRGKLEVTAKGVGEQADWNGGYRRHWSNSFCSWATKVSSWEPWKSFDGTICYPDESEINLILAIIDVRGSWRMPDLMPRQGFLLLYGVLWPLCWQNWLLKSHRLRQLLSLSAKLASKFRLCSVWNTRSQSCIP